MGLRNGGGHSGSEGVGEQNVAAGGDLQVPAVQYAGGEERSLDDRRAVGGAAGLLIRKQVHRDVDPGDAGPNPPGARGHRRVRGGRGGVGQIGVRQLDGHGERHAGVLTVAHLRCVAVSVGRIGGEGAVGVFDDQALFRGAGGEFEALLEQVTLGAFQQRVVHRRGRLGGRPGKARLVLLRYLKDTGIPRVFVAGTGEFTALDDDERAVVLTAALEVYGADGVYESVVLQYIQAVPTGFEVYSGNDVEFGDFVRAGGTGAVSGVSGVFPRPFLDLAEALRRSDEQAAAAAQNRIKQAVDAVGGADVALLKAGLSLQGLPAGPTRVALDQPTALQLETLRKTIQGLT